MKIKVFVALLLIGLVIIGYCISRNNDLSINDIEKYSKDISVEYTLRSNYGFHSYILNISNDSVVEATKSVVNYNDNKYAEFNGYHVDRIKGISAIYDIDNNVVLDLDSIVKQFGYISYECRLLKYDEINTVLYALVSNSHTNYTLTVFDMKTLEMNIITKMSSKYSNKWAAVCKWYKNSIYILNAENELCEYNFDSKKLINFQIKPKCYSIANDTIIYLDKDGLYEYKVTSGTINKLFNPKGFVAELHVNKNATFILAIEELFWFTEIRDYSHSNPYHENCLKLYELSTGKSKVLVGGDREHYVTSADFVE